MIQKIQILKFRIKLFFPPAKGKFYIGSSNEKRWKISKTQRNKERLYENLVFRGEKEKIKTILGILDHLMNTCSAAFIEAPSRYTFERVLDENIPGINEIECYTQALKVLDNRNMVISYIKNWAIQDIKIQVTHVPQSKFYQVPVQPSMQNGQRLYIPTIPILK